MSTDKSTEAEQSKLPKDRRPKSKTKKPKQTVSPGKLVARFLYRFHFVLFIVVVLGGVAVVIFLLNQALISASDMSQAPIQARGTFDQSTIDRLNELNDSSTRAEFSPPPGRTNPFTE